MQWTFPLCNKGRPCTLLARVTKGLPKLENSSVEPCKEEIPATEPLSTSSISLESSDVLFVSLCFKGPSKNLLTQKGVCSNSIPALTLLEILVVREGKAQRVA